MITHELSILCREGDTKVTWDKDDPASREKARKEVSRLRAAGYMFFLVDGSPADEVSAGNGELVARFVTEEELVGEPAEVPIQETPSEPEAPKKRGRKPGVPNKGKVNVVAVPPLRGG
jgi:hypothetical protein